MYIHPTAVPTKHLVLLLKRRPESINSDEWQDNWQLVEGFFYRQNMLSQRVNPVMVTEEDDLLKLLYIFAIYWHGAVLDPKEIAKLDVHMHIVTREKKLDKILKNQNLFRNYVHML